MAKVLLNELVQNFSAYFKEIYNQDQYPNQDVASCEALFSLCVEMDPDFVIDIGTNFGASTLSFAYALKFLGKPLSMLTTIDKSLGHWRNRTPEIQRDLLKRESLDTHSIRAIESDFLSLASSDLIKRNKKGIVFYDIHDNNSEIFSEKFLSDWVPKLNNAIVIVHDFSLVPEKSVLRPNYGNYTMTKCKHFSGQCFSGFNECQRFIQWLNEKRIDVLAVPFTSLINFKIGPKL